VLFIAIYSAFDWNRVKSTARFINFKGFGDSLEKDEKSILEGKVIMLVEFLLFVYPCALISLVELVLNEGGVDVRILYVSIGSAVISILHFSQFYALHFGNFELDMDENKDQGYDSLNFQ
jgi:hypothetical protein